MDRWYRKSFVWLITVGGMLQSGLGLADPVRCISEGPENWLSYSYDGGHSRCYGEASPINKSSVGSLKRAWNIGGLYGVTSTPVVENGVVWFGDWQGRLHQVDLETGAPLRQPLQLDTPQINATPLLTDTHVYLAGKTKLFRLSRPELTVDWSVRLDDEANVELDSSPMLAEKDGIIVIGVASHELGIPKQDYSFRGSVVGLDAGTGRELWRIFTTTDDASAGAGVSVWSTAALDQERGYAYIGTGQTYEEPAAPLSDSLLCINYRTGRLVWTHQYTQGDIWSAVRYRGPDFDIGSSPHLFRVGGRDMVAVGSKGGIYKALDRVTGEVLWERLIGSGSPRGGVMVSGAMSEGVIYTASNNESVTETHALDMATGASLWQRDLPGSSFGTLTLVGGVLLQSTTNGDIYGLDAASGKVLYEKRLDGSPAGGFSVAGDTVLIGYGWTYSGPPVDALAGGLTAFRLRRNLTENVQPVFLRSLIDGGTALIGESYSGSLTDQARDDNGDVMRFRVTAGPEWLKVAPGGSLSGFPAISDKGLNQWIVEVSDGSSVATAFRRVEVLDPNPGWQLPDLSAEAAQVLKQNGCVTCHGPAAPLNLAEWPFRYARGAPGYTDDLAEIFDRIVAITAFDAVPRMPPGESLIYTERWALMAMREAVKEAMLASPGDPE